MGKQKFELFQAQAKDKEHERLIQHDMVLQQGTGFIGGLARSVRPIITYAFFLLFAVIEGTFSIAQYRQEQTFKKQSIYCGTKIQRQSLRLLSHSGLGLEQSTKIVVDIQNNH